MARWWGGVTGFRRSVALLRRIAQDDLGAYAAALGYNFLFALFPLVLFVTGLLGLLHVERVERFLGGPAAVLLPPSVRTLILAAVAETTARGSPAVLSVGGIGFLWGMSGAFRQLIDAMNHVFRLGPPFRRRWWNTYALSLAMGLVAGLTLVVAGVATLAGSSAAAVAARALWGIKAAPLWVDVVRWVVVVGLMDVVLAGVYAVAPDRPRPFRPVTAGTVVALGAWLLLSWAFSAYVTRYAVYARVYGAVGGVISALLYLYLVGFVILLGAEVDAVWEEARPPGGEGPPGG
ncbi:MAG: YihY/virulence factor BrkB family protein [Actinomycetia bacterium]|nr:YihY/virulence factor BrkB family protein [Actinomycetes bacterium]